MSLMKLKASDHHHHDTKNLKSCPNLSYKSYTTDLFPQNKY